MFDKCIKTDIFETNRRLGYSEYGQGNTGKMTIRLLTGAAVATLDYMFEPVRGKLIYKLTSHPLAPEGRIWDGLAYTVAECKKRASGS
jgi:hypothetical protein